MKNISKKEIKAVLKAAKKARKKAYAPYSKYRVGAAVLDSDGNIWQGCNVENISFSETLHAEEVAITNAIVNGKKGAKFKAIAVVTKNKKNNKNPWPCSHCRQVLCEFGLELIVITENKKGKV